ncbi:sodium-dependent transporter [Lentibacillus sp. CBA3610]|uniref:sodium-dependent transporter n=1 Tax=Lentibacillus sp. CBA3610 TaxID=2518176 RepID=UPI001595A861|nr:sodium-dependent transporter [Lentibacillus sp. CBA3610]QKY70193.1 sodium-dependent transporter [Lentibacillus sp. CBA3610]
MKSPDEKQGRESWGSRLGFIMAASGFAIGLGNIWRFPYVAGENGGGAFLLIYIMIVIVIGLPLFLAEAGLGRKAQSAAITGLRKLNGKGNPWVSIGWLGTITALLVTSYYLMIMGWLFAYFFKVGIGSFQGISSDQAAVIYEDFISNPVAVIGYTIIPTLILGFIVAKGVKSGIEKFVKMVMPLFIVMLIILAVFSLSLPGSFEGVVWYLKPDFSQITGGTILAALGQAFFSIGIGFAAAFTYGSYLKPKKSNLAEDGVWVISLDTFIAFLSGLVIFPALFAFQMEPNSGPGLIFMTLPSLIEQMPLGYLFGLLFFFLIIIGALTTGVGLIETLAVNTAELLDISRKTSVWLIIGATFILAIPSILSQGPWSHVQIFGMDIFGFVDYFSGNILLTLGGLLLALYVVFQWKVRNFIDDINFGTGSIRLPEALKPIVTYVIPLVIAAIMVSGLL